MSEEKEDGCVGGRGGVRSYILELMVGSLLVEHLNPNQREVVGGIKYAQVQGVRESSQLNASVQSLLLAGQFG